MSRGAVSREAKLAQANGSPKQKCFLIFRCEQADARWGAGDGVKTKAKKSLPLESLSPPLSDLNLPTHLLPRPGSPSSLENEGPCDSTHLEDPQDLGIC